MYDKRLAREILEKLAESFPNKLHLHELRPLLPDQESRPLEEWLTAVDALRLEGKIDGQFLPDGTSIADAAALYITALGRSELREASPLLKDNGLETLGLIAEPTEQILENIRFIRQAAQTDPELQRKRQREIADLNALNARHLGRNSPEVERQENLLKDARAWAKEESRKIIAGGLQDVEELKARVVKQTWDEFVRVHGFYSDFKLGYRQFAVALWEEGWPSLDDFASTAMRPRAVLKKTRSAPPIANSRPSRANQAEWAACPRPSDIQSTEQPRLFKTERGANQFANAKVQNSEGVEFNFALSDKGWLVIPISPGVLESPKPDRAFREFLPITAVEVSDPPTLDGMLQSLLDDRIVEPSCYLGEGWRFADIERDARKRVGHAYEGRKHGNVDELVVKAVHDLENSLFAIHPNAGASSVASFFGSWQLWRHIAAFCELIGKAPSVRRLDGTPDNARDHVFEQCWVYVHEISAGMPVSESVPKPSLDARGSHFMEVPAESGRESSAAVPRSVPLNNEPLPPGNRDPKIGTERATRKYEEGGHLLAQKALENLRSRSLRRENKIADEIASATGRFRARREELEKASGGRPDSGALIHQYASDLCLEIVGVAATEAADGVREFADGVLLSQGRLGVHANLLREYTGILVSELRKELQVSEVFRIEPLLPWGQDSISQQAIQTCEEILAERRKTGDRWEYDTEEAESAPCNWPIIVQQWEGFKETERIGSRQDCERIPEGALRGILAGSYGITAEAVASEQIRQAGADFCRHYGAFLLLPAEAAPPERVPESIADAQFWREREDEFRKHGTGENGALVAVWSSAGDQWRFRAGSGAESSNLRPESVFKSLAREAAKGLACPQSDERWFEWLNALRRTKYAKLSSTGWRTVPEQELERMRLSGEKIPAGGMIRFAPIPKGRDSGEEAAGQPASSIGGIETQRGWDTTSVTIEDVFNSSADFCLELRSRVTSDAGPIQTGQPARHEIKSLAEDIFSVARDPLIKEHTDKKKQVLARVARTGNSGGYLPALTECACESLGGTILALADAYVDAFTLFGVPADTQAEKDIETSARQMAAGSISGVTGQLALIATRTNRPADDSGGGHLNREINASMVSALKECRLRLKRQRIEIDNSASPSRRMPTPPSPGYSRLEKLKHGVRETDPAVVRFLGGGVANIPELPLKFQNRFETARAKADLDAIADTNAFPYHPQFAGLKLHEPIRIQKVFFAYCTEARNACREGHWTAMHVRQAVEAAWPSICDSYFAREHGSASDAQRVVHRGVLWPTVTDDQRWKQHLSELMALAEASSSGSTPANSHATQKTTASAQEDTPAPQPETSLGSRTDRQRAVDDYIDEVFRKAAKRITRTDLWKSERYKTRTEFERWESYWHEKRGEQPNRAANQKFTRMLREKPHFK